MKALLLKLISFGNRFISSSPSSFDFNLLKRLKTKTPNNSIRYHTFFLKKTLDLIKILEILAIDIQTKTNQTHIILINDIDLIFFEKEASPELKWYVYEKRIVILSNNYKFKIVFQTVGGLLPYVKINSERDLKVLLKNLKEQDILKTYHFLQFNDLAHLAFHIFRTRFNPQDILVSHHISKGANLPWKIPIDSCDTLIENLIKLNLHYPAGIPEITRDEKFDSMGFSTVKVLKVGEGYTLSKPCGIGTAENSWTGIYFNPELRHAQKYGYIFLPINTYVFKGQQYPELKAFWNLINDPKFCHRETQLLIWASILQGQDNFDLSQKYYWNKPSFNNTSLGIAIAAYARILSSQGKI